MKIIRIVWVAAVLFAIAGCMNQESRDPGDKIQRVRAVVAKKSMLVNPVITSGKLSSRTEVRLSFKTGGVIESMPVADGQTVRKGELLAGLDMKEISAQADQAKLAFEKAVRDHGRVQNLYNDSVATLENLQDAKTALEVARANKEIAEFNLNYSRILAPYDGKVLRKLSEEKEIVGPGHPVILFASTESDWVLRAGLTDKDVVNLELGDTALVTFDAHAGETFRAEIVELGQSADPYTGTYEVELKVFPDDKKLISGFIGKARIYPSMFSECIQVPVDALFDANGLTGFVYVLRKGSAIRQKIHMLGISEKLCISSGLSEGDTVITDGMNYIKSGDKVIVVE